jgi:hypothetical protein
VSGKTQGIDWHELQEKRPPADSPAGMAKAEAEERREHWHGLPVLYHAEEGWEWWSGVPDGIADGHFSQEVASFGPAPTDSLSSGGEYLAVWASDGQAYLSYDGNAPTLSLEQARHFRALLDQAIEVLAGYRPPTWMLDPEQLQQRKVEAEAEVDRRVEAACPVCSQGASG